MEFLVPLAVFAALAVFLAGYVAALVRWLKPHDALTPDPLEFVEVDITPESWNPPGAKAYAALRDGPGGGA